MPYVARAVSRLQISSAFARTLDRWTKLRNYGTEHRRYKSFIRHRKKHEVYDTVPDSRFAAKRLRRPHEQRQDSTHHERTGTLLSLAQIVH